jgi:hypothetical protein
MKQTKRDGEKKQVCCSSLPFKRLWFIFGPPQTASLIHHPSFIEQTKKNSSVSFLHPMAHIKDYKLPINNYELFSLTN